MIREFCAENFTNIPKAIAAGANRIELCDNLAVGGTTPSYGVIQTTIEYASQHDTEVVVMIRPRGGDFKYTKEEVLTMCRDILALKYTGIKGVVFGAVRDGWIDEEVMNELLKAAKPFEVTYHMAFDEIKKSLQNDAINWLAERGVMRILTHGGQEGSTIEENLPYLLKLVEYSGQRITILPGGGITYENSQTIADALSVTELHGTRIVKI
ncbi:copper homeostasis protein CutC [Aerococcaceae bacterium DSM 111021]|nr:copper homeostasis protein CutC [Aerococcaceae bacterium DSM 111021]